MSNSYSYQRIIQAVNESPWAILPSKLVVIRDFLIFRAHGGRLTEDEIRERLGAEESSERFLEVHHAAALSAQEDDIDNEESPPAVAVLPLVGTIIHRGTPLTRASGLASVQGFQGMFRQAMANPNVDGIIIDIDSPGGQVNGIDELSTEIFEARGQKPIVAVANSLAASAAYWIATAAAELVVTPSSEVGSVGVFAMHQDISGALEQEGVAINLISAGKYKVEGNPFEPLNEEARAAIQARVDDYYDMFVTDVGRNRGVSKSQVTNGFGQGRVVGARDAVRGGMADRIATLDQEVGKMLDRATQARAFSNYSSNRDLSDRSGRFYSYPTKESSLMPKSNADVGEQTVQIGDRTFTLAQIEQMAKENGHLRDSVKSGRITQAKDDALRRGVSPALVRFGVQILENLEPSASPGLSLEAPSQDGDPEQRQYNLFGAVETLLSLAPGRIDDDKGDDAAVAEENPREPAYSANPYASDADKGKSAEQLEAEAIERRKELGLTRNRNGAVELG